MKTYTPAELTELILASGERLLLLKHGKRPTPARSGPRYAPGSAEDPREMQAKQEGEANDA